MKDPGQVRPILQAGLRSILHSSLILLGLLFAAGASAADATSSDGQQTAADDDATPATGAEDDAAAPSKPGDDVFKPTEEISEDFAVPFPVDI